MGLESIPVQHNLDLHRLNLSSFTRRPSRLNILTRIGITRVGLAAFEPGFWRQVPRPPTALAGVTPVRLFAIAQTHEFHAALTLRAAERLVVTRNAFEFW